MDVTLGIGPDRVDEIVEMVQGLGWKLLVENAHKFVQRTLVLPCQAENGVRVDFIFSFSSYERQAIQRARRVSLGDAEVAFATVEDLLIHKMVAGRPRDLEDVAAILRKNPSLDLGYLQEWLAQFDQALQRPLWATFQQMLEENKAHPPKTAEF